MFHKEVSGEKSSPRQVHGFAVHERAQHLHVLEILFLRTQVAAAYVVQQIVNEPEKLKKAGYIFIMFKRDSW